MSIKQQHFGTMKDGRALEIFTLDNGRGIVAKITNYGCRITELHVPDAKARSQSIVLGYDRAEAYLNPNPCFGAIVGRYANRINHGKFPIDGKSYQIPTTADPNGLHGGPCGFDKVLWRASASDPNGVPTLRLAFDSPDGDQGFPGNLEARCTYSLTDRDELRIDYVATTDKPTIVNLSNHSYFHLGGAGSGDMLKHLMLINADRYTPVDERLIPNGEIAPVRGTPLDFTTPRPIGERIGELRNGYDHNYVLNPMPSRVAARVVDESSGRGMEVVTDEPGVQFYTGGFLDGSIQGIGGRYPRFGGFCLETQHYPDSPNHANFPSTGLRPGQTFASTTVYRFFTI